MAFEIVGNVDKDRLYCTGSFTKFLTTYVCLSFLAENYDLNYIIDDNQFFSSIAKTAAARDFLALFEQKIGSQFSIRDICSYYAGLPYTFDLSNAELENVDAGSLFKHHSIKDEATFLAFCRDNLTPVYGARCKFHYSEISIIFLGYFLEKAFNMQIESLYKKYLINACSLKNSIFSRTLAPNVYTEDLSDKYDYPAIAIQEHGYFCYSNGFYTTLNDEKKLLEKIIDSKVFHYMTDLKYARAASPRLLNGLTVEIRLVGDDILYGYEGLSFSGCNIFAYSTKQKKGYITTTDDEDAVYGFIYGLFGYKDFDKVPEHSQAIYEHFISQYRQKIEKKPIPKHFIGTYQRVKMNDKDLLEPFTVGEHFIIIRNPSEVKYDIIYTNGEYRILCKDETHGQKVGFHRAKSGNHYFMFDGNLYRKMINE